jgi:hypothetical protein
MKLLMRDGGKGDLKRPLVVAEEEFNKNWDTIFGKKEEELEPIPFAGMVDTTEYMDVSHHKNGKVTTIKVKK